MQLPDRIRSMNVTKTAIIGFITIIFGVIFGYYLVPYLLKTMIKKVSFSVLFN